MFNPSPFSDGAALLTRVSPLPPCQMGDDLAHTSPSNTRKTLHLIHGDAPALTGEALEDARYAAAGVINRGRQTPLTPHDVFGAHSDIKQAANGSLSRLGDTHTAATIEQTLKDALTMSWTFQCALGYGIDDGCPSLKDITFVDPHRSAALYDGEACTDGASLQNNHAVAVTHLNGSPVSQPDDDEWLTIYVSAPPVGDEGERDAWKAALIYQVLCVVTGATKPDSTPDLRDGARILTKAVALEMAWQVPEHLQRLDLPGTLVKHDERFASPHGPESALNKVARQIETMGSWNGQHGDIVPAVMRHIYPDLELRIMSERMPAQTFANEHVPAAQRKSVTLSLQQDHYVLGDATRTTYDPPTDGNCFYNSLLYAMLGRPPVREEVQALRDTTSLCLQANRNEFAPFVQVAPQAG